MKTLRAIHRPWSVALLTLLVSSVLVAGTAGPADAVTPPDPVVVPPAPQVLCDDPTWGVDGPCMEIPIGGTVMDDVKAHLIFWLPEGYSFAPGVPNGDARHMALVERLINDLSGSETYNILTQYHDSFPAYPSLAADPTHGYHPNRIRVEGSYVETRPFPGARLSGTDIEDEITRAGASMGWPLPPADDRGNDLFFVFTPVNVQTCLNAPGYPDLCSGGQFAGYHSSYELPVEGSTADCASGFVSDQCAERAYVYVPTLGAGGSPPYPNNAFVDPVLDTMWHELAEAMSDPFNSGWESASSNPNVTRLEVADVCNPQFMPDGYGPRGGDGGTVTLNGNRYLLQRVYSNAVQGCTLGFHGQFVNFRPLAAKTTASSPFSLSADATSRLPVSYGASGPCTVSGAVVTVTGVGTCTLTASQAGDRAAGGFYHPASPVTQAFAIGYAPVTVATTTVPAGRAGVPYSAILRPTPGVAPYSWVIQSGSLPPGISLGAAGALSGTPTAVGTYDFVARVTDSYATPSAATKAFSITVGFPSSSVSIGDVSVLEGDSGTRSLKFPVTLSSPTTAAVSVQYTVQTGTATGGTKSAAGIDVKRVSGTVTFKPSSATGRTPVRKVVSVSVYGDTLPEGHEDLQVVLSNASGSGFELGRATATGTILDDDTGGGIKVGIGDASIVEGDSGTGRTLLLPVTLSSPADSDVSVPFTVTPGTATYGKTATAPADFGGRTSGTLLFRRGTSGLTSVTAQVSVPIWADARTELDESFTITLGTPNGPVVLTRSVGVGTIFTDD